MTTTTTKPAQTKATTIDERRIAGLREQFPELDFADLEVALAVGRASVTLDRSLAEQVKPYGLTPVALQTLISVFLASAGPLSLADLGDQLRVTKANVSLVLVGLEKQKLIRRRADPKDGRKIRATLTKKGEKVLIDVMPTALDAVHEALGGLSRKDRSSLKRLAQAIE
jgi:DNA-binding MarR family transcriptional regulator